MTECTFFDDKQPDDVSPDGPSHWTSITELSKRLRVSRNTISTAVKRAWANEEPWVKKEKATDGNTVYLIDTHHKGYLLHQQRWQQQQARHTTSWGDSLVSWSSADHTPFPPLNPEETALLPYESLPYHWQPQSKTTVFAQWPRFRQWLSTEGLQLFQNLLAEETPALLWQWHWGELHGEGYPSDEEALIAALQARFALADAAYELPAPPRRQPKFCWFRRKD